MGVIGEIRRCKLWREGEKEGQDWRE